MVDISRCVPLSFRNKLYALPDLAHVLQLCQPLVNRVYQIVSVEVIITPRFSGYHGNHAAITNCTVTMRYTVVLKTEKVIAHDNCVITVQF